MGRCNGYRPTKENRAEVVYLRKELSKLTSSDWQKASRLMHRIVAVLGKFHGPSNGMVEPRVCRFCDHYGHTKQFCPKLKRAEEAAKDRILEEDRRLFESYANVQVRSEPYDATQSAQALVFDKLGVPYTVCPYVGPVVGGVGEEHAGAWTFAVDGRLIPQGDR